LRRAYHWYKLALPKVGPAQADVSSRMKGIARQVPDVADPWADLDTLEAVNKGEFLHLDRNRCLFTRRPYKGGIDVTVMARTEKNNIRLTAGQGATVIFNWEGGEGGIRAHRPDWSGADGRGGMSGSLAGTSARTLNANQWYRLHWQLTPSGQKVWLNDDLVFREDRPYDLSAPRPVGVCAFFQCGIDVKSVVFKPLADALAAKE
jgi:hypothetical protein